MQCPYCEAADTKVIDSRPADGGTSVRRRRECEACGNRFTTYERYQPTLVVRKRDDHLEPFSADKVRSGIAAAVADRPLPAGTIDRLVREIEAYVEAHGPEVSSDEVGRQVLEGLRAVDDVAYLRFASVYKDFTGPDDFEREMAELDRGE